jgi:serine/threonine protein kinase
LSDYVGKIISHYRIYELIGRGGMGVVYKAEDTKLKRTVALKFLPPVYSFDKEAKQRFIQEAQAASSLQHNNICNIHDIDETKDGQIFICMDCYEGETLKKKIERGQLKTDEAIDIVVQVATGLQKAHEKGIIHRDIKPANIFITNDGVVKILDFGLAKLSGQTMMTKMGETVGTIAYMSPEQTRGELVDSRTDIWSLGVVLYEMITGKLPFKGDYEQAIIYSILIEQPKQIDIIGKDIPKQLIHVVEKSMEKDLVFRYKNLSEVIKELEEIKTGSSELKKEKSILVLPFDDMSPGKDNEYFSDGLTEELITDLSGVHDLLVISRSSAMTFKGSKKTIREIAREVNVQYVLEGSVRKAGSEIRIAAQLIDATNDFHVWAKKFNGTLDDVFDIQEKVSRSIVNALELQLTSKEMKRIAERPIPNSLAYEFYLKARQEILKWTEAGLENAIKYLRNGLEIVGENALLYAGMAYVYFQYFNLGIKEQEYCRKQAEQFVDKAFNLDPDCPNASFVRAVLIAWNKPIEGIRCFKHVLDKNPNDFDTLFVLSCVLGTLGQSQAVIPLEERTIKIDPLNPSAHFHSGFNRLWEGEYVLAMERLSKLYRSFPDDVLTKWSYGLSLAYMDKKVEADSIFEQITQEQPGTLFASLGMAFKYALKGNQSETLKMLEGHPSLRIPWDFQTTYWKTECYALIGEKELALDCLQRDVDLGMINYPLMNELDPFLASIRDEERFKKLMEKVKYKWEHFEV